MRSKWIAFAATLPIVFATACSSGPKPPQPGTPEFTWSAAKSTYAAGDFLKAKDNLEQLAKGDSEYAAPARAMAIVLSAGITEGYLNLAENFDIGAKTNRANPAPFHRKVNEFRALAAAESLETAELMHKFLAQDKSPTVAIAFGYPTGNASEPVQLQRIAKGMIVPDAEIEALQKDMIQREVLLEMTHAIGAADDPAKAMEIFKAGDVKVPREVFLMAASKSLCDDAELFGPKKLDQPNKLKVILAEAEDGITGVPDSKDSKALKDRIAKMRKGGKSI
jgi:hypothetical protein